MINLFTFFKRKKLHYVIHDSGALEINILEVLLSEEGSKALEEVREFAKEHNLWLTTQSHPRKS